MKTLFRVFAGMLLVFTIAACSRAPSNVKVLQTENCGRSWTVIPTGSRIPTNTANPCGYNITLPDYPMQGDAEFLTQFANNVLVRVQINYDYQITDPLLYIENAKFLGRMKSGTSGGDEANSDNKGKSPYESAENVVIDVRLRELVTSNTGKEDIVKFNPSEFEDILFKNANEVLSKRGVTLNSMTFVILPEEQTRMAIDAATAMAVYESKGLGELGKQLAIAKAGAARIELNQTAPAAAP
ncbi:hypothetical protein [Stenotrophomonas sp. GD03657]|uniref:hypothetical protein n=1 Tax=Stenotrophomonas sp. GD03657 TaxID=2975363 RepID=UPI002447DB42|nr:hypothetical protein [Stenotrophomonas sp. GD03657]MDH2154060.1 hypothetical protein [Stenotrophomonas sp. GD03657]